MGKSEINPIVEAGSDSDSDSSTDWSEESSEEEILDNTEGMDGDQRQTRCRQRTRESMTAPWAPPPYLRRAWTPESNRHSANQYKRSQSVPESTSTQEKKPEKKTRTVQFADRERQTVNNLAWDDNPLCTMLPDGTSDGSGQLCAMESATSTILSGAQNTLQHPEREAEKSAKVKDAVLKKAPNPDRFRFRQLVRKLGPDRWMLKVLAEGGVPGADEADVRAFAVLRRDHKETAKQRRELADMISSIGPKPWMLHVVINQSKAAAKFAKPDSSGKGKEPNKNRIQFREVVRKLGPAQWMMKVLANNGIKEAAEMNIKGVDEKITEEKRLTLQEAIDEIGPKPWMIDVVKNQAKAMAEEKKNDNIKTTKPNEERVAFRQVVRKLGSGPWMLRVLGNNGVPEARDAKVAKLTSANEASAEKRKVLRTAIKNIGPKPWMMDVVVNQAKISANTGLTPSTVVDNKQFFRETVIKMEPRPWMFQVLGNNGVPEAKAVKMAEFKFSTQEDDIEQRQQKRRTFREIVKTIGPKQWMLCSLIDQCISKADKEDDKLKQDTTVDKRREFRQMVRKMKPGSWMIEVLFQHGVQQMDRYPTCVPDDSTNLQQKRTEFLQAMQRIGPKPWMTKVVINQANILAKVKPGQFPPTGNTDTEMSDPDVKEECEKMKKNRKAFAEMVRQMRPQQWMLRVLFNQGLKEAKEIDISGDIGRNTDDENLTKQKRQEFVKEVKKIGAKPWMMKIVVNQARRMADKAKLEDTTDDEKTAEKIKADVHNKRREFVFALNEMKIRPWMLRVLVNHEIKDAEKIDVSIFEDKSPFNPNKEHQSRIEFRQMIRRIGPRPWMARVIRNQALINKARKSDVLPGPRPEDLMTQVEKRNKFRQMIKEMGAEPWMFQVLANQMAKALEKQKAAVPSRIEETHEFPPDGDGGKKPDDVKRQKDTHKMMRQMRRKNPLMMIPAAPDQRKQTSGTMITTPAGGSADDSRESEDDPNGKQMSQAYNQMV